MFIRRIVVLVIMLVFPACAFVNGAGESERMLVLGSALTKLSAAAESTERYKHPPENVSCEKFFELATRHDPSLLTPFSDHALRVSRRDRHAVILVCTRDKTRALLEDAGCTARLDRHLWEGTEALPCEFTLKMEDVCKALEQSPVTIYPDR